MSLPVIGITINDATNNSGLPAVLLLKVYIQAVMRAGGAPLLIPSEISEEAQREIYERLDALLFSGGGDISPETYGGEAHPKISRVDSPRDALETAMIRWAVEEGKPIFGICRGIQAINVALGGALYEDIASQKPDALKHDYYPDFPRDKLAHDVRIEPHSLLARIVNAEILQVNSLHHQAIRRLAEPLRPIAYAPDGIIEAVELPEHPFALGVQWHPEWLQNQPPMRALFRAFVEAAS